MLSPLHLSTLRLQYWFVQLACFETMTDRRGFEIYINTVTSRRGVVVLRLTVIIAVVGSIPIRDNYIFLFSTTSNKTKCHMWDTA